MIRFFVRRPIVAIVISIVFVLVGAVAAFSLPVAEYPDIVPPQIVVSATYPGADALTVEKSVATPLEQFVNGVEEMLYMQSTNALDGSMSLRVTFKVGSDSNVDEILTQNRVSQGQPFLPAQVNAVGITVLRTTASPLMVIAIHSPTAAYDGAFLANYATINVIDELSRVEGVAQVINFGASQYAMRVWVDPIKMASRGLTVQDLQQALLAQNTVNPAGQIGGEPAASDQPFSFSIIAPGRLVTAEEFGDIVVRAEPGGAIVRLSDVARLELGTVTYTERARFDGQPSAVLGVFQTPGTNALSTVKGVEEHLAKLTKAFPEGVQATVALDTTLPVKDGIREILQTLLIAVLLVMAVVFLFLETWRATLIPMLTVPVSLIGAFVLFPILHFSVNTISLLGLVLAIGLVVDDAIVVVEATIRKIEDGLEPREATLEAVKEVSAPVVSIALILASVFIPVAFVPGITGLLYRQFALTIGISVLISAFNALSLSPALCAMLLRPPKPERGPIGRATQAFHRGFERATESYVRLTRVLLRKAWFSVIVVAVVFVILAGLGRAIPSGLVPTEDEGYFFLELALPKAAALGRTDTATAQVEKVLGRIPGVAHVTSVVGFSLLSRVATPDNAFFFVALRPWGERSSEETAEKIIAKANEELRSIPAGIALGFAPPPLPGLGTSGGFTLFLQDRTGGTPEFLEEQANRFIAAASKRPELSTVRTNFSASVPQIRLNVDREKALIEGVSLSSLYLTIQAFLGSIFINDFNRFGREWHVYLQAEPEFRRSEDDLRQFYVRGSDGVMVPITTFLSTSPMLGPDFTMRFNLFRAAQLNGTAAPGYSSGQAIKALEEVARDVLPAGVTYEWSDLSYQETTAPSPLPTYIFAIVMVFLILAALYESWSLPLSVLLVTPVAVLGAFLGLLSRGYSSDVFGQIALIMLMGLSAKNAILIVQFARERQLKEDMAPAEAAVAGAQLRLRPIMMTSLAFILGVLPLAFASGAGSLSRREIGTAVIVGMIFTTILGLLLVPAAYLVVEQIVLWLQRSRKREP
ncbi:efflux RND transporter permease subunit [Vulgatibacter incomptus]|uniref:RND efflux system, inner membrane transporter CmeB n=1 Tax=Vulgatibacter incomptus TaxID=1391653 RepID=A0A0K1PAA7_9BACT|nr:efflux RND transporter permease subunit [Vulgatibacter incomptus]AKU90450.1 RND efflux system, inner membrane transporter CmeB [Vulgatibacter incomptus]